MATTTTTTMTTMAAETSDPSVVSSSDVESPVVGRLEWPIQMCSCCCFSFLLLLRCFLLMRLTVYLLRDFEQRGLLRTRDAMQRHTQHATTLWCVCCVCSFVLCLLRKSVSHHIVAMKPTMC